MAVFQDKIAETSISVIGWVGIGVIIIVALTVMIGLSIFFYKKKKWNIRLEIKLPRSDGQLILSDKGKGFWDNDKGVIVVKRKGFKPMHSRPFDPKRWLKGRDFATMIQIGTDDYIIADENSYTVVKDDATGQSIALMNIVADVGKRKTWKNYTERMSKKAFTIRDWLEEHQAYMVMAVIIFVLFLGFSILWTRQGTLTKNLCGAAGYMFPLILTKRFNSWRPKS